MREITRKFLEGRTMAGFARGLGIEVTRQAVWNWREGVSSPSADTLLRVIASPGAADWARAWAGECLSVLSRGEEVVVGRAVERELRRKGLVPLGGWQVGEEDRQTR